MLQKIEQFQPDNFIKSLYHTNHTVDGIIIEKWKFNDTTMLPSPLRVMELNAGAQSALRLAITVTMALRMVS